MIAGLDDLHLTSSTSPCCSPLPTCTPTLELPSKKLEKNPHKSYHIVRPKGKNQAKPNQKLFKNPTKSFILKLPSKPTIYKTKTTTSFQRPSSHRSPWLPASRGSITGNFRSADQSSPGGSIGSVAEALASLGAEVFLGVKNETGFFGAFLEFVWGVFGFFCFFLFFWCFLVFFCFLVFLRPLVSILSKAILLDSFV